MAVLSAAVALPLAGGRGHSGDRPSGAGRPAAQRARATASGPAVHGRERAARRPRAGGDRPGERDGARRRRRPDAPAACWASSTGLGQPAGLGLAAFGGFLVVLSAAVVAFVLWLELAVRSAAIAAASLFLPLALVGLAWPATSHWARRLGETLAALVLSKLVIAAVLALAAGLLVSSSGVAGVVEGVALLAVAAFAPFALLKLVPVVEAGRSPTSRVSAGGRSAPLDRLGHRPASSGRAVASPLWPVSAASGGARRRERPAARAPGGAEPRARSRTPGPGTADRPAWPGGATGTPGPEDTGAPATAPARRPPAPSPGPGAGSEPSAQARSPSVASALGPRPRRSCAHRAGTHG